MKMMFPINSLGLQSKISNFLISGLLWLFLFSIPFGHKGRTLFQIGHHYIVDTPPVHWVVEKVFQGAGATGDAAKGAADNILRKVDIEVP